ncbi:hypothetical protein KAH94_00560 [bacterium]|nr:hypothetical protein [bacterium]
MLNCNSILLTGLCIISFAGVLEAKPKDKKSKFCCENSKNAKKYDKKVIVDRVKLAGSLFLSGFIIFIFAAVDADLDFKRNNNRPQSNRCLFWNLFSLGCFNVFFCKEFFNLFNIEVGRCKYKKNLLLNSCKNLHEKEKKNKEKLMNNVSKKIDSKKKLPSRNQKRKN